MRFAPRESSSTAAARYTAASARYQSFRRDMGSRGARIARWGSTRCAWVKNRAISIVLPALLARPRCRRVWQGRVRAPRVPDEAAVHRQGQGRRRRRRGAGCQVGGALRHPVESWCGSDFRESLLKSCGTLAKGRKSHESCGTLAKGRESHKSCGSIDV